MTSSDGLTRVPLLGVGVSRKLSNNAHRNVRLAPDDARKFCYVIDVVLVADFRQTFGWASSSGFWGVMAVAVKLRAYENGQSSHLQ